MYEVVQKIDGCSYVIGIKVDVRQLYSGGFKPDLGVFDLEGTWPKHVAHFSPQNFTKKTNAKFRCKVFGTVFNSAQSLGLNQPVF